MLVMALQAAQLNEATLPLRVAVNPAGVEGGAVHGAAPIAITTCASATEPSKLSRIPIARISGRIEIRVSNTRAKAGVGVSVRFYR